jgi:hypothetical protein
MGGRDDASFTGFVPACTATPGRFRNAVAAPREPPRRTESTGVGIRRSGNCDAAQMSITTPSCGRAQQIRTFPPAGGSSGSGW